MALLTNDWQDVLGEQMQTPSFLKLQAFLEEAYAKDEVYPIKEHLYSALEMTSYQATKVVILGQDPYHGEGQAHGMAFSVQPGVQIPPSLRNIYKELHESLGCFIPNNGYLVPWAKQGVLLLNTVLTVKKGEAGSHQKQGWETFTDAIIKALDAKAEPVIFLLWGTPAKKKMQLVTQPHHIVLTAAHPSPLSAYRGFFGCNHFKLVNEALCTRGKEPINWQIPNL